MSHPAYAFNLSSWDFHMWDLYTAHVNSTAEFVEAWANFQGIYDDADMAKSVIDEKGIDACYIEDSCTKTIYAFSK